MSLNSLLTDAPHLGASIAEDNEALIRGERIDGPVFLLAPPRSFSSVVCAMLGQHPQMYGLPEVQLFGAATIREWWDLCGRATFTMADGLLRAVAEIHFGGQTEETIRMARGWLWRRASFTTALVLESLALKVRPRTLVEKSPSIVYQHEFMHRAFAMFPHARFIHLTRHPLGHGKSVIKAINEAAKFGPVPHWLSKLGSFPGQVPGHEGRNRHSEMDPQRGWYILNTNISEFLVAVPDRQKMTVRGEDLLTDPAPWLRRIAEWLGVRSDDEAIEEMKHPERSPFACYGPPGAHLGNDSFFLQSPALRPERAEPQQLDGPLPWSESGQEFLPVVKQLARQFGY